MLLRTAALAFCSLVLACGLASAEEPKAERSLPEVAFEVLKSGDQKLLLTIVMTQADFAERLRTEQPALSAEQREERARALATTQTAECAATLAQARKALVDAGFDLAGARLVGARREGVAGPYDPGSRDEWFDIDLTLESGGIVAEVRLDDCVYVNGRRRLQDGFKSARVVKPGMPKK